MQQAFAGAGMAGAYGHPGMYGGYYMPPPTAPYVQSPYYGYPQAGAYGVPPNAGGYGGQNAGGVGVGGAQKKTSANAGAQHSAYGQQSYGQPSAKATPAPPAPPAGGDAYSAYGQYAQQQYGGQHMYR